MVLNIYVFGTFARDIVSGHINARLIVLTENDGLAYSDTQLFERRPQPNNSIAGVHHSPVFGGCGRLRRRARLELTIEVHNITIEKKKETATTSSCVWARSKACVEPHRDVDKLT